MGEQILVALKGNDRLEQIIPYLENVARPGMKVVFLIHYPVTGGSQRLRDHRVTAESVEGARLAGEKIRETHWSEEQGRLAEHKVFLAQEALRKRGVEIVVDVYTGSLRRAVKSYVRKGGIHLIMMRARTSLAMMKLLPRVLSLFGFFQQSSLSPMLLLHPDQVV